MERSEEELAALAPTLSFAFMRGHKERFEPISVAWKPGFRFLRKGQVRRIFVEKVTIFMKSDKDP